MNKNDLIKCFEQAINNNYRYIGVKVLIEDLEKSEIVISQFENFQDRLEHYTKAFDDDDLVMKNMPYIVKITGFSCGDTFDELEKDLIG